MPRGGDLQLKVNDCWSGRGGKESHTMAAEENPWSSSSYRPG